MKLPPATVEFSAIAAPRAVDEIESQIRAMVAQGLLKPGDRLPSERDLAAKLNVSRNTLREAMRTLERAGILEMRKGTHGGAYILHGNSDSIIDGLSNLYHLGAISPEQLTEARIWLSEIVVRVACERATEEDLRALDENIQAGRQAIADDRFDIRQRLHREFHLVLARMTRNPIIEATMAGVMEVMGLFIERIGPSENAFTEPARDRLMKHLRKRDAEAAVKEMTSYLKRLQTRYLDQWAERRPPER